MAILSEDPQTDRPTATQESMFDEPVALPSLEAYDAAYDVAEEPAYETGDDFAGDATESVEFETIADEPALDSETEIESGMTEASPVSESRPDTESEPMHLVESTVESKAEPAPAAVVETEPLTVLTIDDFAALEDHVLRAVNLVRQERQARSAAEERAAALDAQLQAQSPSIERLQQEVDSLRVEREQVRQRVERLLSQLDALEL